MSDSTSHGGEVGLMVAHGSCIARSYRSVKERLTDSPSE